MVCRSVIQWMSFKCEFETHQRLLFFPWATTFTFIAYYWCRPFVKQVATEGSEANKQWVIGRQQNDVQKFFIRCTLYIAYIPHYKLGNP